MVKIRLRLLLLISVLTSGSVYGANSYYVWTNSPHEGWPYNAWTNAAHAIQTALNVATNGETVWVTNGVYDSGTTLAPGTNLLKNRVCVTNAVILRSVNGPGVTLIKGDPDGVTGGCGDNAVRCVYLTNSASLIGFTLTNGYTMTNGDSMFDAGAGGILLFANTVVSNCLIVKNTANSAGGAILWYGGTMDNCMLSLNVAMTLNIGGAYLYHGGIMNNCVLYENSTPAREGGAYVLGFGGIMNYCTFSNNYAGEQGGGVYCNQNGVLNDCLLAENRAAGSGGGAYLYKKIATMINCKLIGNIATYSGGGVYLNQGGMMKNCLLSRNASTTTSAGYGGGGAMFEQHGTMTNCTIVGNSAAKSGGGLFFYSFTAGTGGVNNCIIWGNTNSDASSSSNIYIAAGSTAIIDYTCSGPAQAGMGNIGGDPLFADTNGNYNLKANSPCINAGTNADWMTNSVDLAGRTRIRYGIVDMGAYEAIYDGTIYKMGF